jgi:hypothetical protein
MDGDRPLCAASPWYIAQSGGVPVVPLADDGDTCGDACVDSALAGGAIEADGADGEAAGAEGVTELAAPEQPAIASVAIAASALQRRRPTTAQVRCSSTPPLYHSPPRSVQPEREGHD